MLLENSFGYNMIVIMFQSKIRFTCRIWEKNFGKNCPINLEESGVEHSVLSTVGK